LSKVERPVEALAALAELRKAYPMSRWLQDAAALEMEIKQSSGQGVTPESLSDEELKLLALNSVMRSDPERAIPAVESLLKQAHSPAMKRNALYVLAQSDSLKAQELMERVARGGMNADLMNADLMNADLRAPDLQALAVRYLAQQKRTQGNLGQALFEIYNSTGDAGVKREALNGLAAIRDTAHLSQIAPYRLWMETEPNLLQAQFQAAFRKDQDEEKAGVKTGIVADYQSQKDRTVKQGIIDAHRGDATALIAIARVENDPYFKKRIVEYLIDLNTPEAKEYLLEILK
jgi:hypothetical protein